MRKSWTERGKVYLRLMRADKPIGTLLLLWPTLWALWIAGNGRPTWYLVILFMLGTFLMRSAGCVVNDFADRNFDGAVERTKMRPFAQGEVTPREAFALCVVLCLLAMLCLIPMNRLTWLMSLPALFLAVTYPFTKRFFPLPQLYLGLAYSFGIPMAFAAQAGTVPPLAWLLFFANVAWTLAYDTIYAIADKPDDLKIGIKTSAVTFGDHDVAWVMFFHVLFAVLMAVAGYLIQASWVYWLAWCVALVMQLSQYFRIRSRDRMACFHTFLFNNRVGLVLFVGVWLHYVLQAA
ncbi:MAG: 4-hydroxybenzoate octaprenyltransferase [Neisseria sp.]|nr:4-hydroxybenzoate octaprenyltransferase [Neisseria sp.]